MQQYTIYLFLQTALHVSDDISSHHQELILLYLQCLALLRPLLLPVVSVTLTRGSSNGLNTLDTVVRGPDDGWRYHLKHVEQFAYINKLHIVASCWIIIDTYYAMSLVGAVMNLRVP